MSGYNAPVAVHPGETMLEFINGYPMTQSELAARTGLAKKTINEIVKGKSPITHDTAQKLAIVLGTSASFWSNLQNNYDEAVARLAMEDEINAELEIARRFTCRRVPGGSAWSLLPAKCVARHPKQQTATLQ